MKQKECRYCCEMKPITFFTKNISSRDGFCHFCRDCLAGYRQYQRIKKGRLLVEDKVIEKNPEPQVFEVSFF
jgi:hypothetical protein